MKDIVKNYKYNRIDPNTQQMLFLHMINHVANGHCVSDKNKNGCFVDLETSAGLDVAITEFQTSVLNPTGQDVVISDLISESQGDRAEKN